ncbi:hypothetical protein EDD16DRAFT_1729498 [Pisolithus croceorrhizus]|nr:hypothetical protein EDD16DRAFT_1729498 [Pisolithus croceorrhizus]
MSPSLPPKISGAYLVGFQIADCDRHFGQTVSHILAYESLLKDIRVEGPVAPVSTGGEAEKECRESARRKKTKETGRFIDDGVTPMDIDVNSLREKKCNLEVEYWVQLLRQRYTGMLMVERDKLDEIQVVLIQVALRTTEFNEPAGGVPDIVAPTNVAFSMLTYQPVVFLHVWGSTFSRYLALLTVTNTFMVTSMSDVRRGGDVLMLSEFTGMYSCSAFRSCFAVNPYDTRGTAKAIYRVHVFCPFGVMRLSLMSLHHTGSNNA